MRWRAGGVSSRPHAFRRVGLTVPCRCRAVCLYFCIVPLWHASCREAYRLGCLSSRNPRQAQLGVANSARVVPPDARASFLVAACRAAFCKQGGCGDRSMTREEALENAIASLKEWSEGKAETSVVLAAIAELMAVTLRNYFGAAGTANTSLSPSSLQMRGSPQRQRSQDHSLRACSSDQWRPSRSTLSGLI
ncbi:hypothetical protein AB7M56_000229 [Bradyrhizobium elkanii]|nr:hypothetical protein [Bradyrhizobium elkanii]MCS3482266.1 hypothetical protein [Bradyrhizobium elkanii]MCS4112687.1 hypothetical protein [Bradyrhizobium elkanii]